MTVSQLRVGLVVPRFSPFRGGVETYTAQAAAALADRGAQVTVITQMPSRAMLPDRAVVDGYTVERHRLPIGGSFDVPSAAAAWSAWRPDRFDVVWTHSYHTPLAWLAAERAKVPVVLTPHYHGTGHTRLRQALHRPYRVAGRRLIAASRRIVVDTDCEADLVLRDFPRDVRPEQLVVVPLAVAEPTGARPPFPGDLPVLLTVARQEPYKRTDLIVRAIAELRRRGVPARLIVVGDGAALPEIRRLATELDVADVVTCTGRVDDETLGRWWASAAVYVTASGQEAFGIGLAEALVAGLPVVASGIPAHREVIRRAGPSALFRLCATPGSADTAAAAYADAVAELLAAPGSRGARAAHCTLPTAADMADRLWDTLTAAGA